MRRREGNSASDLAHRPSIGVAAGANGAPVKAVALIWIETGKRVHRTVSAIGGRDLQDMAGTAWGSVASASLSPKTAGSRSCGLTGLHA